MRASLSKGRHVEVVHWFRYSVVFCGHLKQPSSPVSPAVQLPASGGMTVPPPEPSSPPEPSTPPEPVSPPAEESGASPPPVPVPPDLPPLARPPVDPPSPLPRPPEPTVGGGASLVSSSPQATKNAEATSGATRPVK